MVAVVAIARGLVARAPHRDVAAATPVPIRTAAPQAWSATQLRQARSMLASAFAPVLGARDRASLVVLGARGETIYSFGERNAVTPASVQKLVVGYSALNLLGARYRFHTILAAAHDIASDGTLDGNVWLVGSGDPSFRREDLQSGVAGLRAAGLRSVSGSVAIDPSLMHGPEINPHWNASDAGEDFQAPISGISLDGDTIEFRVYGGAPGQAARVVMLPQNSNVHTYGSIVTSGYDSVVIAPEANNTFRLGGSIPPGIEEKFWLPIHGVPAYAGNVLQTMLNQAGIRTASQPIVAPAPIESITLWDHRSAPLPVLVAHMLYLSDNHYAEQLLRTLGGDAGAEASDRDGIEAEVNFLRSRAIPIEGLRLFDGSGLAEENRISATTLARILSDAQLRGGGVELYPLLPDGGHGTLKYYPFGATHVRAKTGHLSDADSLAGYLDTKHHGRLAFAFLIDNSPGDPDRAYVHALVSLSEY